MSKAPSLRMGISAFIVISVYVGPSIVIWGGTGQFFAHPARASFVAVAVIAVVVSLFSGLSSSGVREDRSNRWIFIPVGVITVALCVLPPYMDRNDLWTLDGDAIPYLGLALFITGAVLRIWPMFTLGPRFCPVVAVQENHTLEMGGLYRVIRHPSYLGLIVGAAGFALVFRSTVGLGLALLLVPIIFSRIHAEEKLLISEFGAAYKAYEVRTWRLIPYLY